MHASALQKIKVESKRLVTKMLEKYIYYLGCTFYLTFYDELRTSIVRIFWGDVSLDPDRITACG